MSTKRDHTTQNPTMDEFRCEDGTVKPLSLEEFAIIRPLGKGSLGSVFLAEFIIPPLYVCVNVALKIMQKRSLLDLDGKLGKIMQREVEIHSHVKHKNIINFLGYFDDSERVIFIMEFQPGGTVLDQLQRLGRFDEGTAANYVCQLRDALEYLHSLGVLHRDLKAENIVLKPSIRGEKPTLKIIDFGGAAYSSESNVMRGTLAGTWSNLPPEMLGTNCAHDFRVDLWNLGLLAYEFVTGKPPFASDNGVDTIKQVISRINDYEDHKIQVMLSKYTHVSTEARQFIAKLLAVDMRDRLTLKEIRESDWLKINCTCEYHCSTKI